MTTRAKGRATAAIHARPTCGIATKAMKERRIDRSDAENPLFIRRQLIIRREIEINGPVFGPRALRFGEWRAVSG
jgi:hypothetical protein